MSHLKTSSIPCDSSVVCEWNPTDAAAGQYQKGKMVYRYNRAFIKQDASLISTVDPWSAANGSMMYWRPVSQTIMSKRITQPSSSNKKVGITVNLPRPIHWDYIVTNCVVKSNNDAFTISITDKTNSSFYVELCRVDGDSWGQSLDIDFLISVRQEA